MPCSRSRTIGLLGGSFNPAHEGHRFISLEMMKRLRLDEVWWLVSPHNPLKAQSDLADYALRLSKAKEVAQHPHIRVSDVENKHNLRYTIDTVLYLKRRYPRIRFIWLMGSDSLKSFHRWKQWRKIAHNIVLAVWDRGEDFPRVLRAPAALALAKYRIDFSALSEISKNRLPAWSYFRGRKHPLSASFLRKTRGKKAFDAV